MAYTANIPKTRRYNRTCDKETPNDYSVNMEGLPDNKQPTVIQYLSPDPAFYTIEDVMKLTKWSRKVVQRLFNRKDFPCCDYGKARCVEAHALIAYFAVRRNRADRDDWE